MNYNQFEPQFTSAPQQINEVATVAPVQNTKKSNLVLVFVLTIILSLIIGAGGVLLLFKFKPNLFNLSKLSLNSSKYKLKSVLDNISSKLYGKICKIKKKCSVNCIKY